MHHTAGERVKLRDAQTGAEYGPAEIINGATIKIGETTLVVEAVESTAAQEALEKKLKSTMLKEMGTPRSSFRMLSHN